MNTLLVRTVPPRSWSTLSRGTHVVGFQAIPIHTENKFATVARDTEASLLDENTYNEISDKFLEGLQEKLQTLEQACIDDFDIEYGHGVLTLRLGAMGTYVLNKQAPNKQIWWSSPLSGPKRFNLDIPTGKWVNNRDFTPLTKALQEEIKKLCNIDITL